MKDIVRERVERILKAKPITRDCDKALILEYLHRYTRLSRTNPINLEALAKAIYIDSPGFETITRRRREIQRDGFHRPTAETMSQRKATEKAIKLRYR